MMYLPNLSQCSEETLLLLSSPRSPLPGWFFCSYIWHQTISPLASHFNNYMSQTQLLSKLKIRMMDAQNRPGCWGITTFATDEETPGSPFWTETTGSGWNWVFESWEICASASIFFLCLHARLSYVEVWREKWYTFMSYNPLVFQLAQLRNIYTYKSIT